MFKIAIGGQLNKNEIQNCLIKYGAGKITSDIFTDMDAAMKVKNGSFDYYVGACQSVAGGALAMAYTLIGRDKCATIANALTQPSEANISQWIDQRKKAFGFTNDRVENSVKALCAVLLAEK
ncbi:TPA: DUF2620 family protein [Yersinia enterocolitica]|nr:DUF2620 family protein [Yersinia enterocolitica]MBW5832600.1 DUF2620 family protein [Yersinia enterocolitica]HDL8053929.1 DUF2620 family protein [Yersinia enterocolitica]HDM8436191.1 DUF2620 family protein [Yersinia enterocolitica]HEI6850214.1 DUF2620 family protein [Yersinia enterocolitica]HEN3580488.1 DUF2620 family protein [Yersinia enterocolitica]